MYEMVYDVKNCIILSIMLSSHFYNTKFMYCDNLSIDCNNINYYNYSYNIIDVVVRIYSNLAASQERIEILIKYLQYTLDTYPT